MQVRRRRPICAFELNDESAGEEKTPHTNWIVMRVTQVEIALEEGDPRQRERKHW